ncbi:hypothetical protein PIB30_028555 [Stylosanthes scabra]|uniref:RNase H type-1 domain-containing protein n=1 Tax=Stylosanthes scabra TaxID=79078 RepID=A0ABU6TB68_9FABA|nr:hypothetical protein [Stylosanthes scabra]
MLRLRVNFGCVLRGCCGDWLLGYYGQIPVWTIFRSELLAVWNGLRLAWEAGTFCGGIGMLNSLLVKREANSVADWLAKTGALCSFDYCLLTALSLELDILLRKEATSFG